jgi:polyribonucleotide nucleotidyltransferase
MSEISYIISELENKLKKLVDLHLNLKEKNKRLINENEELKKNIEDKNNTIINLKDKNNIEIIANQLGKNTKNKETRSKINELVRDIENCIALLNK